jgi:hypothetical protein
VGWGKPHATFAFIAIRFVVIGLLQISPTVNAYSPDFFPD